MIFLKSLGIAAVLTAIVFGSSYGVTVIVDVVDAHHGREGVYTLFGSFIFSLIFLMVHFRSKKPEA